MSERLKYYLPLFSSFPLLLTCIWRIFEYTPIHYDGSYFIFNNLLNLTYSNDYDISRRLAHFIFESFPIAYATYFTTRNFESGVYLYSASTILIPFMIILSCWWILPRNKKELFYYPLIAYSVLAVTSLYFDCSEMNLSHAVMWVICSLLMREEKSKLIAISLVVLSLAIAFVYPLYILLFPSLITLIWWKREWDPIKSSLAITILLLITVQLSHHHSELMPDTVKSFIEGLRDSVFMFTSVSMIILSSVFLTACFLKSRFGWLIFSLGSIFAFSYFVLKQAAFLNSYLYSGRVTGLLICVVLASFMILCQRKPKLIHAVVFIGFSIYATGFYLSEWRKLQDEFLNVSQNVKGIVSYQEFTSKTLMFQHSCTGWNAEMFSILIQVMNKKPVSVIVRKLPDYPESFLGYLGLKEFKRQMETRNVKFEL